MSIVLALVLCGVGVIAPGLSRWRTGDFAGPAALIVATWSIAAGLFLLRMLPYPAMPAQAAGALLLGVGSLLAGTLLAAPLSRRAAPRDWPVPNAGTWVVAFSLVGIAGTLWYVWEVQRLLGLHALLDNSTRIRIALAGYEIPSRFLFLQFFCIIAPILAAGLWLGGTRFRAWQWSVVAACIACTWITTDRTQFFIVVLAVLFMYLLRYGRSLSVTRSIAAVLVAGTALSANFLAVGYWTGRSPENLGFALSAPRASAAAASRRQRVHTPGQPAVRMEDGALEATDSSTLEAVSTSQNKLVAAVYRKTSTLYLYATGSFAAFALWFPPEGPPTYGLHCLYPVVRLFNRLGVLTWELPAPVLGFTKVVRRGNASILFNGYTLLYYPISDFGVVGMVVYCLVLGLIVGITYERTRRVRTSSLHLLLMGQFSVALVLSVFVNKFNSTMSWYLAVATTAPFLVSAIAGAWRDRTGATKPEADVASR